MVNVVETLLLACVCAADYSLGIPEEGTEIILNCRHSGFTASVKHHESHLVTYTSGFKPTAEEAAMRLLSMLTEM
jgi:hypothetical protein